MTSLHDDNVVIKASLPEQAAISFSRGTSKIDNAPVQSVARDFDEFEAMVLADRAPKKGLTFICAPLGRGVHYQRPDDFHGEKHWRLLKYVEPRQFHSFDFDGFADVGSFAATRQYLSRYRGFGYTTASHTAEAPRARAILLLSRPVNREDGKVLGELLQSQMLNELGAAAIKFDTSVYRGEQPVYTPVTSSETFHFPGEAVDVDAVLATKPPPAPLLPMPTHKSSGKKTNPTTTTALPQLSLTKALAGNSYVLPDGIIDGENREDHLLRYAGHLRGKGLDQQTIERTLLDYNKLHITPPVDEDKVLDRARRYDIGRTIVADGASNDNTWPDPVALTETLPQVPPFDIQLLPKTIGAYVQDVAERMSCPVDFPAIAAVVTLATAIGSRIHCRPYDNGNWMVPAGAWGMVVSSPSAIKSPPMSELLRPLKEMDKIAAKQYAKDMAQHEIDKGIYDAAIKAAIKAGNNFPGLTAPSEPTMTRYVVNDSTYEMLVAIAAANPNGFLVWRDELVGWFHSLNKENQKEARGLYLTGFSGTEDYATDRIGRGHLRADTVNLSLLGTIQPNVLRQIVYDAVAGGGGDDGLVARLQFAVFPDPVRKFVKVDRRHDIQLMQYYHHMIQKLVGLDAGAVGASVTPEGVAYLPFDEEAQKIFDEWRQALEDRILDPASEEHPAMLAHLGKYRALFPKLALILHLAAGKTGPIGEKAAIRAQFWTEYLEAHARRIYHTATNRTMQSAVALANKIKAGRLADGFTKSDVLVKDWAGLRTAEEVATALTVLQDGGWLMVTQDRQTGGRPAGRHAINPKVKRAA